MQTAKSDRFAQPSNRRTGPVMLAALILLAIAIGFIDHLPTFAQEDTRAIGAVQLESNQPGELHVSWDPPTDTPRDYRIIWARVGEDFLSWTDSRGNAFPTSPSYTITGLDEGVRYKVRVRARYASGNAGGWTDVVEAIVASAPTATYTPTPTATNTATLVPTVTYTAAPEPTATHTATPVPTATYTATLVPNATYTATLVPNATYTATLVPTATYTATLVPNATYPATLVPTATNTATPSQQDFWGVGAVRLESNRTGVIAVAWDPPTKKPHEYRLTWARVSENFPSRGSSDGNAFPRSPSYTITGLDEGVRYKVKVRARYLGGNNVPWSDAVEIVVASTSDPTATSTPTTTATHTATHTPTATYTATPSQQDFWGVGAVHLESNRRGVIAVAWDPPTKKPHEYRLTWARVSENFPSRGSSDGNAFPRSPSYTITGLDEGVRYKVKVRARYLGGNNVPWSDAVEIVVASTSDPTATSTPTTTATHTPTATYTATATPIPTPTPTPTPKNGEQPPLEQFRDSAVVITDDEEQTVLGQGEADPCTPQRTPPLPRRLPLPRTPQRHTATPRRHATATHTATATPTATHTATATAHRNAHAVTPTATHTATATPTATHTATATHTPSVTPTATATPTVTATPTPSATTVGWTVQTIGAVRMESNQPGVVSVSWDPPDNPPRSYRIGWARVGEDFPAWQNVDSNLFPAKNGGNAYPTEPSYTLSGLDENTRYKVKVRARYRESSGPWTGSIEIFVVASGTATNTPTPTPTPTSTPTPTHTPTPTPTPTLNSGEPFALAQGEIVVIDEEEPIAQAQGAVIIIDDEPPPMSDRDILVTFYNALDGPNWVKNSNWLSDEPLSQWYGVSTNGDGRVTYLNLSSNGLNGQIPAEVGGLSELRLLNLNISQGLHGPIPPELGNLSKLTHLSLGYSRLTGTIPPELGNLSNLVVLGLSETRLTGTIPAKLGNLSNLTELWLSNAAFGGLHGSIPPELGKLTKLKKLYLDDNNLSGSIPPQLGNLTKLIELRARYNNLSGPIPPQLGNLTKLVELNLRNNQLTGSIPPQLATLARVQIIKLYNNRLTGTIPPQLADLPWLVDLFLRGNNFSGCIPFTLYRTLFHDLWQLNRPACPAPDTLTTSTDRAALVALYNATSGASWTNNSNWLSDNPIYTWRGVTVDGNGRVTRLSLPSNGLSGSLPSKLGELTKLAWLDLNGNSLTGTIPSELGSLTRLSSLYLNDNQLSGSLPSQLGLLMEANYVDLHGNNLSGSLPLELRTMTSLGVLVLNGNSFTGNFPTFLTSIDSLKGLYLEGSTLTGCIPPEFRDLEEGDLDTLGLEYCVILQLPPGL